MKTTTIMVTLMRQRGFIQAVILNTAFARVHGTQRAFRTPTPAGVVDYVTGWDDAADVLPAVYEAVGRMICDKLKDVCVRREGEMDDAEFERMHATIDAYNEKHGVTLERIP